MVDRPPEHWRQRLFIRLGLAPKGRSSERDLHRPALQPFFPSGSGKVVQCANCRAENPAEFERCRRCRLVLVPSSPEATPIRVPLWIVIALLVFSTALGVFVGRQQGRASSIAERNAQPLATPASTAEPTPSPATASTAGSWSEVAPAESGPGWNIYRSKDRVTGVPLVGARFLNGSQTQLLSVLCGGGESGMAIHRTLLPATDGGSEDVKVVASSIAIAHRVFDRDRQKVQLTLGEEPTEMVDVIPEHPADFLRRVAKASRVRTTTDDFDPRRWAAVFETLITECGLDKAAPLGLTRRQAGKSASAVQKRTVRKRS